MHDWTDDVIADLVQTLDRRLRQAVTADAYTEILRRNRQEPADSPVCHSHDFVDANMIMDATFRDVFGHSSTADSNTDAQIIDTAWSAWRSCHREE